MSIPGQSFNILDPGLGLSPQAIVTPLFLGVSEKGTDNTVYSFTRISDAVATLGQGPLTEAVCTYLAVAGGPVVVCKLASNVAGVVDTATLTGTGTGTIGLAGKPFDAYEIEVRITKSATFEKDPTTGLDTTTQKTPPEFSYSLDGGYTYSDAYPIPSGGKFLLAGTGLGPVTPFPSTGLELTFAGVQIEGDLKKGTTTAPHYNTGSLNAGIDAVIAAAPDFAWMVLTGDPPSAAATAGGGMQMASALHGHAEMFRTRFQFVRGMCAAGRATTASAITEFTSFASTRVLVTYGHAHILSRKPFPGWGVPKRSIVDVVAARAGSSLISTDLGRVASGALNGVLSINHNEAANEVMDQKRFTTLRTLQGYNGFYITNGRLMSPPGSDYRYWQHGRLMDVACDVTYRMQMPMLGDSTRVTSTGAVDPRDAARYQAPVQIALNAILLEPASENGTPGHVTTVVYQIDQTANLLVTETLQTAVSIRPRGYIKHITTQLGFAANVGG